MCVCGHVCVKIRSQSQVLFVRSCPPNFWYGTWIRTWDFLSRQGWLASEFQGSTHLDLPSALTTSLCYHSQFFAWMPGPQVSAASSWPTELSLRTQELVQRYFCFLTKCCHRDLSKMAILKHQKFSSAWELQLTLSRLLHIPHFFGVDFQYFWA